jgi:hypothetical protein
MSQSPKDFFIGWAETPKPDRRFLLGATLGLIAAGAGIAALAANAHPPAGSGTWDQGAVRTLSGYLLRAPFPALVTTALGGKPRTVFLVGPGKTGIQARLGARTDGPAEVRGSLIVRGEHAMLAAVESDDWLRDAKGPVQRPADTVEDLGAMTLIGEILDAKCWFGAMRPGDGKVHKACASLCIRGGLPPAFCIGATCGDASAAPMFLDQRGEAHGEALLPFVADPIMARGHLTRVRDVIQFRVPLSAITRL